MLPSTENSSYGAIASSGWSFRSLRRSRILSAVASRSNVVAFLQTVSSFSLGSTTNEDTGVGQELGYRSVRTRLEGC